MADPPPPPNPFGPAPYSTTIAIFLVTIIEVGDFFRGGNEGGISGLYHAYSVVTMFTLISAVGVVTMDVVMFKVDVDAARREKLLNNRKWLILVTILLAWIGFTLYSIYKVTKVNDWFGFWFAVATGGLLLLFHGYLFYVLWKNYEAKKALEAAERAREAAERARLAAI